MISINLSFFCRFWPWFLYAVQIVPILLTTAMAGHRYWLSRPWTVKLEAWLCKTRSPGSLALILRCYPTNLEEELRNVTSNLIVLYHGIPIEQTCRHGDVLFFSLVSLDPIKGEELSEEEMQIK